MNFSWKKIGKIILIIIIVILVLTILQVFFFSVHSTKESVQQTNELLVD